VSRYVEQQGRLDEARQLALESIAIRRVSPDSASMYALPFTLNSIAVSYQYAGVLDSAEAMAREALEVEGRLNGRRTQVYANVLRTLAGVLDTQQRPTEADSLVRASIDVLQQVAGPTHPDYLRSVTMLAGLQMTARNWPETERSARVVVAAIGGPLHESHPQSAVALQTLGVALSNQGKVAGADSALRRSLALREQYLPPEHWAIASSRSVLGHHLAMSGRVAEGEPMLRRAYDALVTTRGADADPTLRTAERLAEVFATTGRPAEAARWRRLASPTPVAPTG
jgi:tetratricopeptide (TPR) repeat protein